MIDIEINRASALATLQGQTHTSDLDGRNEFGSDEKNEVKKKHTEKNRKMFLLYAAIYFVSVSLRLLKLVIDPILQRDGTLYLLMAEKWSMTGSYIEISNGKATPPPIPLWCIKEMIECGYNSELAGVSLSIILGGLISVIGFAVVKSITNNNKISAVALLLFLFHPSLVTYSIQPLRENYSFLAIGCMLLAALKATKKHRLVNWFICGVFLCVAFFCRYESIEFIPVILCVQLFTLYPKNKPMLFASITSFVAAIILTGLLLINVTEGNYRFLQRFISAKQILIENSNGRNLSQNI